MVRYGYKLTSEEHGPRALVANACLAEEHGFDLIGISDHFHPWLDEQGHSPFAWSVLGAIAQATTRIAIMTGVTCPFLRYHPAIIAQAAASTAILSDDRFVLGLGSGEALNERVVGLGWPHVRERQDMLRESVDIIRALWSGEEVFYRGEYLTLEDARLFDLPAQPPKIALAAGGKKAAALAAEIGDALVATEADAALTESYAEHGGDGPRCAEISVCWAASADRAERTIHELHRWSGLGWNVLPELGQPEAFRDASRHLSPTDAAKHVPHGPDPKTYLEAIAQHREAGFDHLILAQIGPDQRGFFKFWQHELVPALRRAG